MKTINHQDQKTVEDLYGDIIDLPHYEPRNHPRMALYKRAAQFAPFAALTGYGDQVEEAARYIDRRIELTREDTDRINGQLVLLRDLLKNEPENKPEVRVSYFQPDERKEGGTYLEIRGTARRIDENRMLLVLSDGRQVAFEDISYLEIMNGQAMNSGI